MQQIINFVIRNKSFLLFLLLFGLAVSLTIQSHSYHRSKFITSANWFSGGLYNGYSSITSYFKLRGENNRLVEENQQLRHQLFNQYSSDSAGVDTFNLSIK